LKNWLKLKEINMASLPNNPIDLKTTYDKKDKCFYTISEAHPGVLAEGQTKQESEENFFELLAEWEKLPKSKNKGGRPKKNNTRLDINVDAKIRSFINVVSAEKDINQGKVVEEMALFYAKHHPELTFGLFE
jgi:predicted RNase H-like HicB family nuclease